MASRVAAHLLGDILACLTVKALAREFAGTGPGAQLPFPSAVLPPMECPFATCSTSHDLAALSVTHINVTLNAVTDSGRAKAARAT
ncbi:MAG: hypothetical protein ACYDCA_04740 [Candidatus Tyrphobacter sp.]